MTFTREQLTAAAEVDPWALLGQLQAGDPNEIDELAAAFYRAGGHAADAEHADARATQLAQQGYRVNSAAPVDESAEVARTRKSLVDAVEKLPKIAKVLTAVAEDLATTTGEAAKQVSGLEQQLTHIEQQYDDFLRSEHHRLTPQDVDAERAAMFGKAVNAVHSYGTTVNTAVMNYEHTLATATKSMADR